MFLLLFFAASSAAHSKKILASDSLSSEGPEEDNIVEGTPNACSGASMFGQSGHSVIPETQSQDLNYTKVSLFSKFTVK